MPLHVGELEWAVSLGVPREDVGARGDEEAAGGVPAPLRGQVQGRLGAAAGHRPPVHLARPCGVQEESEGLQVAALRSRVHRAPALPVPPAHLPPVLTAQQVPHQLRVPERGRLYPVPLALIERPQRVQRRTWKRSWPPSSGEGAFAMTKCDYPITLSMAFCTEAQGAQLQTGSAQKAASLGARV